MVHKESLIQSLEESKSQNSAITYAGAYSLFLRMQILNTVCGKKNSF